MTNINDTSTGTHPMKDRIARALRTSQERFRDVADAVELSLAEAVKRADEAADSIASLTDLIQSTIDGAVHAGSELADVAKGVWVGVLRGTRRKGDAALQELTHAARTIMCHTAALGGDMAAAARGIVQGSIHCAKEWGLDARNAASAAARRVLDVTEDLGAAAREEVRRAMSGKIEGVQVPLDRPFSEKEKEKS
jgi:ElaB/YqjD/DUF883 family membrane-anchored ribosome-binding protein